MTDLIFAGLVAAALITWGLLVVGGERRPYYTERSIPRYPVPADDERDPVLDRIYQNEVNQQRLVDEAYRIINKRG